jgi:peptidoglycan/xylan/chitin deacetylase (PgdA/CDA1 family)
MIFSYLFALIACSLAATATYIPEKRQNASLATVYSSCTEAGSVALTFDDGPYIYLKNISDTLTAAGAKGTFFFNGNNWDCIYEAELMSNIKYAYNAGHQIGQHTWSHADLTQLTTEQIEDGFYRMEEALSRILGIRPAFFRPPFGNSNDNIRQISYARNQSLAMWDQDTQDADGATVAFSKEQYTNAVNQKVPSMLFLNHEPYATTAGQVLPFAINLLQSNGYKLVTLAECVGQDPYTIIGVPQPVSSTWSCNGTPAPGTGCSGNCQTTIPPVALL